MGKPLLVWTALMVGLGAILFLANLGESLSSTGSWGEAGYVAIFLVGALWFLGVIVLGVADALQGRKAPGSAALCTNCATPLYRQWWNSSQGAYECRYCGEITAGRAPDASPAP
jgi:hypothetical protein